MAILILPTNSDFRCHIDFVFKVRKRSLAKPWGHITEASLATFKGDGRLRDFVVVTLSIDLQLRPRRAMLLIAALLLYLMALDFLLHERGEVRPW